MAFGLGTVVPGAVLEEIDLAAILGVSLLLLLHLRRVASARVLGETVRVLIVGAAATALGLSGLFASEVLMERIHKVRHPGWPTDAASRPAVLLTLLTGWLALKLFRRIKPTVDPGPYFAGALLLPAAGVALALRRGWPELGAIAAIPALAFMLSRFVESTARKMAVGLLGAVPLLLLMTPDDYRVALDLGGIETPVAAQFAALFLALFPFVLFLAHVAAFQDCLHSPVWWGLSGPWLGGVSWPPGACCSS